MYALLAYPTLNGNKLYSDDVEFTSPGKEDKGFEAFAARVGI